MSLRPDPATAQLLHADALEGQLALRLAGYLQRGTETLSHDVAERLRIARAQAVARASQVRRAATAAAIHGQAGGSAVLAGPPPSLWLRLASMLPLLVLVVGLVAIQRHHLAEQIRAAAEIDAALLADELPPDAYRDPGFTEFLRSSAAP